MPIHINEIVIRAIVEKEDRHTAAPSPEREADRETLVADCLDEVFDRLREKRER
jgi:hypothetical protein